MKRVSRPTFFFHTSLGSADTELNTAREKERRTAEPYVLPPRLSLTLSLRTFTSLLLPSSPAPTTALPAVSSTFTLFFIFYSSPLLLLSPFFSFFRSGFLCRDYNPIYLTVFSNSSPLLFLSSLMLQFIRSTTLYPFILSLFFLHILFQKSICYTKLSFLLTSATSILRLLFLLFILPSSILLFRPLKD